MATSTIVKARTFGTARTRSLKIRLIEPAPPSVNILSYGFYPRLGLPLIGAALKAAGHDVLIYCPQAAPIDRDDVASADLVGISTTTSTAPAAYALADELRAAGLPVIIGGPHPTFVPDDALPHADFVARGEGGDGLMLELIEALAGERELESIRGLSFWRDGQAGAQRAARALRRSRLPAGARPLADRGRGAHPGDAHHDEPGVPVRLHLLHRDDDVRARLPLPQPRERDRRARGQAAEVGLLLRRQLRRQQAAPQEAPPHDDRPRPHHEVAGPGAHRRGPRRGAPDAHAALRLPSSRPRLRVGRPGDAGRLRQVADGRGHRARHRRPAPPRHQGATACSSWAPTTTPRRRRATRSPSPSGTASTA